MGQSERERESTEWIFIRNINKMENDSIELDNSKASSSNAVISFRNAADKIS